MRSVVVAALLILSACSGDGPPRYTGDMDTRTLAEIIRAEAPGWMEIPGVVMVYEGALPDGTPCIKIGFSTRLSPQDRERLPRSVEGHPVLLVETGEVEPK